jgi:hypothetical protein
MLRAFPHIPASTPFASTVLGDQKQRLVVLHVSLRRSLRNKDPQVEDELVRAGQYLEQAFEAFERCEKALPGPQSGEVGHARNVWSIRLPAMS